MLDNTRVKRLPQSAEKWICTVCLGSTNKLCLGQRLKHANPLEMSWKVVSVIEMTLLYDARHSIALLRPKNNVKLLTRAAEKFICLRKWA